MTKEKKAKPTRVDKKVLIIKNKLGQMTGTLNIWQRGTRFCIVILYTEKGKKHKEKHKDLFSCPDLKFCQDICDKLSLQLTLPYNPTPIEKSREARRKSKEARENAVDIDRSLFKEYRDHCCIMLTFGSIWLEHNKFHGKHNYEKLDGVKINELAKAMKSAYNKCEELLKSYSEEIKQKILKEVYRFGSSEDVISVKATMGYKIDKKVKGDNIRLEDNLELEDLFFVGEAG